MKEVKEIMLTRNYNINTNKRKRFVCLYISTNEISYSYDKNDNSLIKTASRKFQGK